MCRDYSTCSGCRYWPSWASGAVKTFRIERSVVPKKSKNSGSTPTLCLDKAVLAQRGGGVTSNFCCCYVRPTDPSSVRQRQGAGTIRVMPVPRTVYHGFPSRGENQIPFHTACALKDPWCTRENRKRMPDKHGHLCSQPDEDCFGPYSTPHPTHPERWITVHRQRKSVFWRFAGWRLWAFAQAIWSGRPGSWAASWAISRVGQANQEGPA
jgi:hypothetical protein